MPQRSPNDIRARIYRSIDVREPNECWPWTGKLTADGYAQGAARIDGQSVSTAYRVVFWLEHGYLPKRADGRSIDHLCRNRACCNPAHLEDVPHVVNLRRSPVQVSTIHAKVTHCPFGHPLSGKNLLFEAKYGKRRCKACHSRRAGEWWRRNGGNTGPPAKKTPGHKFLPRLVDGEWRCLCGASFGNVVNPRARALYREHIAEVRKAAA